MQQTVSTLHTLLTPHAADSECPTHAPDTPHAADSECPTHAPDTPHAADCDQAVIRRKSYELFEKSARRMHTVYNITNIIHSINDIFFCKV